MSEINWKGIRNGAVLMIVGGVGLVAGGINERASPGTDVNFMVWMAICALWALWVVVEISRPPKKIRPKEE